jgi:hypothetical protein
LSILIEKNFSNKKKLDLVILIAKISIIIFSAYSITANFLPFYEGSNPYFYGVNSVLFANGQFSVTSELLQETGWSEIIPENWLLTDHGTAVPMSGTGLIAIGSLFYLIGGYYGLFYLAPICFIILLIASERTSSKLFGNYVGFFTLLTIATSNLLFRNSIEFQTESIFSLFIIVGVFYLIKFLKTKNNYFLLLSTIIFTLSTWIRFNGLIALPLEIFIISTYFLFVTLTEKKNIIKSNKNKMQSSSQLIIKKIKNKKFLKILLIIIISWSFFLISHTIYYEYNFGDPLQNYGDIKEFKNYDTSLSSILDFEYKDYENIKQFSKYLLPYQIPAIYNSADENFEHILGNNWIGLISIGSLLSIIAISFYTKDKRIEVFVLMIFILSIVLFFSLITTEHRAEQGVPGRYMLPAFVLSSMIFGYFLQKIMKISISKDKVILKRVVRFSKIILIIILGVFFIFAFYFSNPVQIIIEEGWHFKNPEEFSKKYPLSLEGLSDDSIIVTTIGTRAVEYGLISFNPVENTEISSDSIKLLEKIINDGYDVYTFKIPFIVFEKNIINSLVNEHGFILKDYSKTFCKVEFQTSSNLKSDDECLNNKPIRIPHFLK